MDTWVVHYFNQYGAPRIVVLEVQATDIMAAISGVTAGGVSPMQIISARLKAPIVIAD